MSFRTGLDRDEFQKILASAFAVQRSGLSSQFTTALIGLQGSIKVGKQNEDGVLQVIAECAREVAKASGTAVALLDGNRLIYRAGTGSAQNSLGQEGIAVLSASRPGAPRHEILRVENAQTDSRIEAAICRQFGAMSLLILPIYDQGVVAGVLEVCFNAAHQFKEEEVCTYQLMVGLIEKSVFGNAARRKTQFATELRYVPGSAWHGTDREQLCNRAQPAEQTLVETLRQTPESVARSPLAAPPAPPPGQFAAPENATPAELLTRPLVDTLRYNLAAAGLAIVICVFLSIAQRPGSVSSSTQSEAPATSSTPVEDSATPRTAESSKRRGFTASRVKRVRVGANEVDYVADDVTIRHFILRPPSRLARTSKKVNMGEDVTVWHFDAPRNSQVTPAISMQSAQGSPPVEK